MAKAKQIATEREYVIPLRREILKVSRHKRTPKAVKALKQFLAKHMRIPNRDVSKIKLDDYLNKELWHRGIRNPPTKVKVKVKRDGENIQVSLVDLPEKYKFEQARKDKKAKALEKTKKKPETKDKKEETPTEQTEEKKAEEKEKSIASAEAKEKMAEAQAKQQKHIKKEISPKAQHRKALQK